MLVPSGTDRRSLSSKLVEVVDDPAALVDVDPTVVDVVDVAPSSLVGVVLSSKLVEVVESSAMVGVVTSAVVGAVLFLESSWDVLVDEPADVIDVDVASSLPAQATPTTASPATIDVNTASIFFNISYLLGEPWGNCA